MVEYPVAVNPAVDEVVLNPALDPMPVKIEYIFVDTDKQTTRCVLGPRSWTW
jgi:hypothetical protein